MTKNTLVDTNYLEKIPKEISKKYADNYDSLFATLSKIESEAREKYLKNRERRRLEASLKNIFERYEILLTMLEDSDNYKVKYNNFNSMKQESEPFFENGSLLLYNY